MVHVNLGESEFTSGLTLVALTRCTNLDGLMISHFNRERLFMLKNNTLSLQQRKWFEEELVSRAVRTKLHFETRITEDVDVSSR